MLTLFLFSYFLTKPHVTVEFLTPMFSSTSSGTRLLSSIRRLTYQQRPQWLQAIFHDKRTYFDNIADVEKCFLTGVNQDSSRQCFTFSFDGAPRKEFRLVDTSFVALRESCRCPQCFAADPQQRVHNLVDLNLAEKPANVKFDRENQLLHVEWTTNGHQSVFSGPWLYATFTPHPLYEKPEKKLWKTTDYLKIFPQFDFSEICSRPEAMLNCLTNLATYGLVTVKKAPAAIGTLAKLSFHMNYIKKTHYGEVFQVENKPNVTNIAYAHGKLTQHSDLPYFDYVPGIQFLHCVRNSKQGGENSFADMFAVAEKMRQDNAADFEVLTTTKTYAYNYTADVSDAFLVKKRPPISLNQHDGSLKRIAFSNPTFDSLRELSVQQQRDYLKALQTFMKLQESPEFRLIIKLEPGEIAIFDNTRCSHGREAFDPKEPRLVEGMYLDWDEIYSRIRVIKSQLFREKLNNYYPEK